MQMLFNDINEKYRCKRNETSKCGGAEYFGPSSLIMLPATKMYFTTEKLTVWVNFAKIGDNVK